MILMQKSHAFQAERGEVAIFLVLQIFGTPAHFASTVKKLYCWNMMVMKKNCARILSLRSQFCMCSQSRVLILEFCVIHGTDSWPAIHCSSCQPWIEECVIHSTMEINVSSSSTPYCQRCSFHYAYHRWSFAQQQKL